MKKAREHLSKIRELIWLLTLLQNQLGTYQALTVVALTLHYLQDFFEGFQVLNFIWDLVKKVL